MSNRTLPPGWRWARLDDICVRNTGTFNPATQPDSIFTYVDISSVDNSAKRIVEPKQLLGRDAPSRARQRIRTRDVLVATTRPNLNAVALVPLELDGQICSTGFCVLRPKEGEAVSDYLFGYVQSAAFVSALSNLVVGALYPAVTDQDVRSQVIPLPPLAEQQRIAVRLAAQLAAVERARAAALAQRAAAAQLTITFMRDAFATAGGPLPPGWRWARLGELLQRRNEIVHPYDNPTGTGVFVGLEHIEPHTGRRIGELEIDLAELTGRKPRFRRGDIVYGYLRPYLNKVWIADFDGYSSVDQYAFKVDQRRAETEYVAAYLRSPTYLSLAPVDQSPGQLPRIRSEEVADTLIPLPLLETQRAIVARLKAQADFGDQCRLRVQAHLADLDALPAALLRTAFAGGPAPT